MPPFFKPKTLLFWGAASFVILTAALSPSTSRAVTVGPAKLQISVDPGQSATGFLYLKNDTAEKQVFHPFVQKFSQGSDGQKVFTTDTSGIASWMHLPASVELGPGEDEQVPFTMNAPKDAAPGGHFAVIWWSASPADGGDVAIVTRAGVLVYVRVSGAITEKGHIASFAGPRFALGLPVDFNISFVNEGNVAVTPQGNILIKNLAGTSKADLPVNPYGAIILPGSNGSFSVPWQGPGFFFNIYSAELQLRYGESNQAASQKFWFVLVSPWAGAVVILLVLLLFAVPPLVRKYNRWIIERAQQ